MTTFRKLIELADGNKISHRRVDDDPDFPGETGNIQEVLRGDIASYLLVADNVPLSINTNLLSVFNNTNPGVKVRIEKIEVYPRTLGASVNNAVFQIGYINSLPTGTTNATVTKLSADYPPQTAQIPVDQLVRKIRPTTPNPLAAFNLGGNIVQLNPAIKLTKESLFEVKGNGSALILRPGQDGITIRQVDGNDQGTVTFEMLLTI